MGTDPNEGKGRKGAQKASQPAKVDFWTWHPTEADKAALQAFCKEADDLGTYLEDLTKLGIVFTLTRAKTNDSLCVVARNRFDNFGEGQALSVFHVDPLRALWGMVYVLSVLHPTWPAKPITARQQPIDW